MPVLLRWVLGLGVLGGLGLGLWLAGRPQPVAVVVTDLLRGRVESLVANTRIGTVEACRRARLAPGIGGQIAALHVRVGERVAAGAPLLQLWHQDTQAELRLTQTETRAAAAKARSACLQSEVARREATRLATLQSGGAVSEEAWDQAETQARMAEADCQAAQATAQVSVAREAVVAAELERGLLVAPFAGVLAEVNGELGEYVTPSPPGIPTPPAVDLIDDSCFFVSAPIDEVDAPAVRPGLPARIGLDAFPERTFAGQVRRKAPYVLDYEKQARTVEVEVAFTAAADIHDLLAGYSADVEIILEAREDTWSLPTEAILQGDQVLVWEPDSGRLVARSLKVGLANWEVTEVLDGLRPGEAVVTSLDREGVVAGARAVVAP